MTDTHEKIEPKRNFDHKITRTLIVKGEDEPEKMSWEVAMLKFGENGVDKEWRLPTKSEFNFIYENRDKIGNFDADRGYYWSSSEYGDNSAWGQRFRDGCFSSYGNGSKLSVRCVRR